MSKEKWLKISEIRREIVELKGILCKYDYITNKRTEGDPSITDEVWSKHCQSRREYRARINALEQELIALGGK